MTMMRLLQILLVVEDPREGDYLAKHLGLERDEYLSISNERGLQGFEPGRLVIIRGFVNKDLYAGTEFFRQLGAVVLDIDFRELRERSPSR